MVQALAYAEFRNKRDSMTFPVHYLFFPAPSTPFLLSPFLSLFSLPINPAKDLRRRSQSQTPLHGHRLRTPPTDELTTILQQICLIAMPEPNISTCQDVGMWQIFVGCWCSLVDGGVFVAGVRSRCRVVEFGSDKLPCKRYVRPLVHQLITFFWTGKVL